MEQPRAGLVVVLAASVLLGVMTACGEVQQPVSSAGGQPALVGYVVPPGGAEGEGRLFVQTAATSGVAPLVRELGQATEVWQLHRSQDTKNLLMFGRLQGSESAAVYRQDRPSGSGLPAAAAAAVTVRPSVLSDGSLLQQRGRFVMGSGSSASMSKELPQLEPDPQASVLPPGYKGLAQPGPITRLAGAFSDRNGRPVLVADSQVSAAVLTSAGEPVYLPAIGHVSAVAQDDDGYGYVVGWGLFDPEATARLFVLPPTLDRVISQLDLGVSPGEMRNAVALDAGRSVIIGLFHGEPGHLHVQLWRADKGRVADLPAVPDDSGLDMSLDQGANAVLVFGGPAENRVSRVDLATGQVARDVPELRAPQGSVVVAVSPGAGG